ncbi:hypothetical protein BC828DRAFT_393170 [Blastocladiella britannica]|nr:hypothetical protein BC828DRAFT_393170 [Blastocladiella britannica]
MGPPPFEGGNQCLLEERGIIPRALDGCHCAGLVKLPCKTVADVQGVSILGSCEHNGRRQRWKVPALEAPVEHSVAVFCCEPFPAHLEPAKLEIHHFCHLVKPFYDVHMPSSERQVKNAIHGRLHPKWAAITVRSGQFPQQLKRRQVALLDDSFEYLVEIGVQNMVRVVRQQDVREAVLDSFG